MVTQIKHILSVIYKNIICKPKRVVKYLLIDCKKYSGQSYYPEESHKSSLQICLEQICHIFKYGEICEDYYYYGFDVKGHDMSGYVSSYLKFATIRNQLNLSSPFNSSCLLRNKFYFGVYANVIGLKTPNNIALCKDNKVLLLQEKKIVSIKDFLHGIERKCDFFMKGIDGQCGEEVFHLSSLNGKFWLGGKSISISELENIIERGTYIFQERFYQHKVMSTIYPKSVNTIRIITVCKDGEVHILPPVLRIGAMGNEVDNYSRGGVIVEVDLETGKLTKFGKRKQGFGEISEVHPDSGVRYDGIEIPYWKETIEQVKYFHKMLFNLHSIGWDIAIGVDGPVFIEGNDNWEISLHQMWRGIKADFDVWFS